MNTMLHCDLAQGGGYLELSRVPVLGPAGDPAFFTFHIAYSPSYRVPVLHFEAVDAGLCKHAGSCGLAAELLRLGNTMCMPRWPTAVLEATRFQATSLIRRRRSHPGARDFVVSADPCG